MRQHTMIALAIFAFLFSAHAQTAFQKQFTYRNSYLSQTSVSSLKDGGYILICGQMLVRYSAVDTIVWKVEFKKFTASQAVELNNGNIKICGYSYNDLGYELPDVITIDASGKFLKGNSYDVLATYSIIKNDRSNNIIVTGNLTNFNEDNDGYTLTKFNRNGDQVYWSKRSSYGSKLNALIETRDSNYALAGYLDQGNEGYLSKIDNNGNLIWAKKIYNEGTSVYLNDVKEIEGGKLLVCGQLYESFNTSLLIGLFNKDGSEEWIKKVKLPGTLLRLFAAKNNAFLITGNYYDDMGNEKGLFLSIDSKGNFVSAKITKTNISYLSSTQLQDKSILVTGSNSDQIILIRTDTNGNTCDYDSINAEPQKKAFTIADNSTLSDYQGNGLQNFKTSYSVPMFTENIICSQSKNIPVANKPRKIKVSNTVAVD